MIIDSGFDSLHFSECLIHGFSVDKNTICLNISNVYLLNGHPQYIEGNSNLNGQLYFKNVLISKRGVTEYIRNTKDEISYGDEYTVEDSFPNENAGENKYFVEGVLESPEAWLDWQIVAGAFYFKV